MSSKQTSEGYNGIYLERSGKGSLYLAEKLVAQPEFPLDEFQKQEIYEFEKLICDHRLDTGLTLSEVIRNHKGESKTAPRFFAEAFLGSKLKTPMDHILPMTSSEDVYKRLTKSALDSTIDETTLLKISKESADYYKQTIADHLVSGETPDASVMDNMSIVINPGETILSSLSVVQARQFLHDLRHDYQEGGDRVDGAKRALADVYLAKINGLVVSDITTLDHLIDQSNLIGDLKTARAATEIISEVFHRGLDSDRPQTLRRLDYIRNGMGTNEHGRASAIESSIIEFNESEKVAAETEAPLFTLEQRDKLKAFTLSPQEMKVLYSRILQKAGLLSSEDSNTWSPKRTHRAADGLFQVVISPTAKTFSVNGRSGAYKVASEDRSLFDVIVVGGFHELEHVNQTQTDCEIGKKLNIAEVKGKRVSMLRESGANFRQREAEQALFGKSKPIALAYARALEVIEGGGDVFTASRSFYDEKLRIDPDITPQAASLEAADRVLRLTLHGGLNSQPMAYSEETLLNEELRDAPVEVKVRAIAVTSLDLVDQVRLHKYDLIPLPENYGIDWTSIILNEAEPYIAKALSSS